MSVIYEHPKVKVNVYFISESLQIQSVVALLLLSFFFALHFFYMNYRDSEKLRDLPQITQIIGES